MFLIYTNELIKVLEQCNIKVKLFADDVELSGRVLSDCAMSIGNANFTSNFNVDGNTLPIVTSCRDLGVIVTHNLFRSTHIDAMVITAHQRANLIHRSFVSHNPSLQVHVYVRPLLEYNCVIWSPWLKQDIDKIERVQRRFNKRLLGFKYLSYSERLLQLNMTGLELRRLHADLIICYKLIFGPVECKLKDFFTLNSSAVTRGHMYKLYKNLSKTSIRKSFFLSVLSIFGTSYLLIL